MEGEGIIREDILETAFCDAYEINELRNNLLKKM